jgi:hypothetical protein
MHFSLDSHFHRRGEGRFYAGKKGKAKKFTLYFIKTYHDWGVTYRSDFRLENIIK